MTSSIPCIYLVVSACCSQAVGIEGKTTPSFKYLYFVAFKFYMWVQACFVLFCVPRKGLLNVVIMCKISTKWTRINCACKPDEDRGQLCKIYSPLIDVVDSFTAMQIYGVLNICYISWLPAAITHTASPNMFYGVTKIPVNFAQLSCCC